MKKDNYFINLNTLQIEKGEYKQEVYNRIELKPSDTVFAIREKCKETMKEWISQFKDFNEPILFTYNLTGADVSLEEGEGFFNTAVNIINSVFFEELCNTNANSGRPRERRLDVPENLKLVNTNMSLLKNAINKKTLFDKFNIVIKWTNAASEASHQGFNGIDYKFILVAQGDEEIDN